MVKPQQRTTRITIAPIGEPIFSDLATKVSIDVEPAGEYIKVSQQRDDAGPGQITIDPDEWPVLRDAIDKMMANIQE